MRPKHPTTQAASAARALLEEIEEGVALLRPNYPDETEDELWRRAAALLNVRYALGHWPSEAEVAEHEKKVGKSWIF
jgi:hypothetical protein